MTLLAQKLSEVIVTALALGVIPLSGAANETRAGAPYSSSVGSSVAAVKRAAACFGTLDAKPGTSKALSDDAKVVDFDIDGHPYYQQGESSIRAWLVHAPAKDYNHLRMVAEWEEKPPRSFNVYIDSLSGRLIEIRSDTATNSRAPSRDLSAEEWKLERSLIHETTEMVAIDSVVIDTEVPESSFLEVLATAPCLLGSQYIVAYSISVHSTSLVNDRRRWLVVGYGAKPVKDGQDLFLFLFDADNGQNIAQIMTVSPRRGK